MNSMQIVTNPISISHLQKIADPVYGNLVKGVVDVDKKILVVDAALHADLEHFLLEQGSSQSSLWGINLHPQLYGTTDFIEYDSMINLRPNQNNYSRSIDNPSTRQLIQQIIGPLFTK